jgi:hypothetical protein
MATATNTVTWADQHPEVAANNARPTIPWPCEKIETNLGSCHQPGIVKDDAGELYAEGVEGKIFHSADGGREWSRLCKVVPMFEVPKGMKQITLSLNGLGVTASGGLVGLWRCAYSASGEFFEVQDPTLNDVLWITRSEDRGRTWSACPPFEPPPGETMVGGKMRIHRICDDRLMIPIVSAGQSRPGKPVTPEQQVFHGQVWVSADDGRTWSREGFLGDHCDESDLLQLPSGRVLASIRYQRKKLDTDPDNMVDPLGGSAQRGGHSVYKNTAFAFSDDDGRSWSPPRIVSGFVQQTGCLVRLSDGTIVLPYSRKDGTHGQRFVVSYDEGRTWSNAIYELNDFGMFASTVALDDDTLVTVHETPRKVAPHNRVMLHALRWKAPLRGEVEKHGFFEPRLAQ